MRQMMVFIGIIAVTLFLIGCKSEQKSSGFVRGNLPDKIDLAKPGISTFITPEALLDSINAGKQLPLYLLQETPFDTAKNLVHIPGMIPILLGEMYQLIGKLPKNQPIYLLCMYGDDSKRMGNEFSKQGLTCYYLDGGVYRFSQEMKKNNWRFNR
jgi:rhodanese-related sulfurtransferase